LDEETLKERLELAGRVAAERERLGLSQEQLGAKAGITYSLVKNIENAERPITIEVLAKLCDAFGEMHKSVVYDWIIGRTNKAAA
jgi:transcriptional regulator with XRE-family HTH domain